MKPIFKLLIVANVCPWNSWDQKIQEIQNFFAPLCDLRTTIVHTDYTNIPMQAFKPTSDQYHSFAPNLPAIEVSPVWYEEFVTPLAPGYDIVLLVLPHTLWPFLDVVSAVTDISDKHPVRIQMASDENEATYLNGKILFQDAQHYAEHEICHALFFLSGSTDTTHYWDYLKLNLPGALNDIHLSSPASIEDGLLNAYKLLLQAYKEKLMDPKTSMLDKFCLGIQQREGYYPPGVNTEYSQGTPSWKNNNPGNCRFFYGGYLPKYGTVTRSPGGFAVFETYALGWMYLQNLIRRIVLQHPDLTIASFFAGVPDGFLGYSPASDNNDPVSYANEVAGEIGVPISMKMSALLAVTLTTGATPN